MALVVPLGRVDKSSIAVVGGKAQNLGVLTAAGFAVPAGFVVTTEAYELAVGDRVDALLDAGPSLEPGPVAQRVRATVSDVPVPGPVRRDVLAAYRQLGADLAVAVRSSATAEDLASASFAG